MRVLQAANDALKRRTKEKRTTRLKNTGFMFIWFAPLSSLFFFLFSSSLNAFVWNERELCWCESEGGKKRCESVGPSIDSWGSNYRS